MNIRRTKMVGVVIHLLAVMMTFALFAAVSVTVLCDDAKPKEDSKVKCHENDDDFEKQGGKEVWQTTPLGRTKRYAARSGECANEAKGFADEAKVSVEAATETVKKAKADFEKEINKANEAMSRKVKSAEASAKNSAISASSAATSAAVATSSAAIATASAAEAVTSASDAKSSAAEASVYTADSEKIWITVDQIKKQIDIQQPYLQMALARVFETSDTVMGYADRSAQSAQIASQLAAQQARLASQDSQQASRDATTRVQKLTDDIPAQIDTQTEKKTEYFKTSMASAISNSGTWMMGLTLVLMIFLQIQTSKKNGI